MKWVWQDSHLSVGYRVATGNTEKALLTGLWLGWPLAADLTPLSFSVGVRENMLETLIPKVQGKQVMIVLGPQAGRVSPRPGNGDGSMQGMCWGLGWLS